MKLQFTHSAQRDLIRLREFIAKKNPQAARRISQQLKNAIKRLIDHPDMGVDVRDLSGVQDLISGDYITRYIVVGDTVCILRVWHGKEER